MKHQLYIWGVKWYTMSMRSWTACTIIALLLVNCASAFPVLIYDQGSNVRYNGVAVDGGSLTVQIWDDPDGGSLVYAEIFNNAVNDGRWMVTLGEGTELNLEYGHRYYKDYQINGQDLDFTNTTGETTERQAFDSPLGGLETTNFAVSLGDTNTASGWTSTAAGVHNTASGGYSVALGAYNQATGAGSVALGGSSGSGNTASGTNSFTAGWYNTASGNWASAIGYSNTANGDYAVAIGVSNTASGKGSAVFGGAPGGEFGNTASGSYSGVASGKGNIVNGGTSVIAGGTTNTISSGGNSFIGSGINNYITSYGLSVIGGGQENAISYYYDVIGGGNNNNITSGYSVIAGGNGNLIQGTESAIVGGDYNVIGPFAYGGFIGGGWGNVVNSFNAAIPGGRNNIADGGYTFLAGENNTASGESAIAIGASNNATGDVSFAEGHDSLTRLTGQHAQAGGSFAEDGDAQYTSFIVRGESTDDQFHDLSAPSQFTLADEHTYAITVTIAGRQDTGANSAMYKRMVIADRTGGTVSLIGATQTIGTDIESDTSWDVNLEADDSSKALRIQVKGNSQNIRWVAAAEAVEIGYSD
jgi:hypothetical protein